MNRRQSPLLLVVFASIALPPLAFSAESSLPPPAEHMSPWKIAYGTEVPGEMSAAALLEKPAGRLGPVTVRDGHFFTGDRRLRFWGASIAFSGALPTHEQADHAARRLANFGINCIRFHHIDMQPFPNGIFADSKLEALSPEALDRLDFFISALKAHGIYSDLNLHVSRNWARTHNWPNAEKLQQYDKQVDVFYPELIAANKQYARDLLTHQNAYTKTRYADEPAVAFLEINNEDTLFLWGGEDHLAKLPDPYAKTLQDQFNAWLSKKYAERSTLRDAWAAGAQPPGKELLLDPKFSSVGPGKTWVVEQHGTAKLTASADKAPVTSELKLDVTSVDDTSWHLQLSQARLALKKGQFYTLSFRGRADKPVDVTTGVGQAHEPWQMLGLSRTAELDSQPKTFTFGFTATADDDNARVSFLLGRLITNIYLSDIHLHEGGQRGLADDEDPAKSTVARGGMGASDSPPRSRDWYDFLQQTDEAYFTGMRQFLQNDLGVKCPITGTIGLGPLGTMSQSKMDFVDAHAYFQHPSFPHRQWDMSDWQVPNTAMVDDPKDATLWSLAATRVIGKPFTCTEYNHPAPNDWQAECVPMIATYAALQDWDGVFLFDYVDSSTKYDSPAATDFFSVEGNPVKLSFLPLAARLFLGAAAKPIGSEYVIHPPKQQVLDTASHYFWEQWPFLRDTQKVIWPLLLSNRLSVDFLPPPPGARPPAPAIDDPRIAWTSAGPGTGQFRLRDPAAAVFVGFAGKSDPIDLGPVAIERLETPFAAMMLLPAEPGQTIEKADRLLLCIAARQANTGMKWDSARKSVGRNFGGPPPLIEVVHATLRVKADEPLTAYALTPEGKRGEKLEAASDARGTTIQLGTQETLWYELTR
jgi:hypothetical protein